MFSRSEVKGKGYSEAICTYLAQAYTAMACHRESFAASIIKRKT